MWSARPLISVALLVLAFGAQALAVQTWRQPSYDWTTALFWQIGVALLAAFAVSRLLAHRLSTPSGKVYGYACIVCLLLPVLGLLLCCATLVARVLLPAVRARRVGATSVRAPEFVAYTAATDIGRHWSGVSLRAKAQDYQSSEQDRLSAMAILQSYPTHTTAELWEGLFSDSSQNVRQFASGIIADAREAITRKISVAEIELGKATIPNDRVRLCVRLAELHWELIYQKLVRQEDHDLALDSVVDYAHRVLALDKQHAAMWYFLGRCALLRNNPAAAEGFLQHARLCHFPVERLLPWLAEAAFLQRDYDRVRVILGVVNRISPVPTLQPIVRYWTDTHVPAHFNAPVFQAF